ncbi:MAG: hypothetical protein ACRDF4_01045 [Rhabdochlamydiaceae bacterium]
MAYALDSESELIPKGHFMGARFEQSLQRSKFEYDIIWFVWDRDGIFRRDDWEPLILFWKDTELIQVTARPHFEWQSYYAQGYGEPNFVYPLKVAFITTYHAAVLETTQGNDGFEETILDYKRIDIRPKSILTASVPASAQKAWFNKKGHHVSFGQNIHDKAIECLEEWNKKGL